MKSIQFFKGLSWLMILNLLIKPLWIFFIDRQVQNSVGYEEYGKYFSVLNLSYVLFFLSDAGLSNMMNQRIANNAQVNIHQFIKIKIFLLISYVIACCFAGWLTHMFNWTILLYVVTIQALTSLFVFLRSIVTANQFFTVDAWFSVMDKFLMIIICGSILYTSLFGTISLLLFLQIQTFCTAMAVTIAFLFLAKRKLMAGSEKKVVKKIFKYVLPFAAIILLMSVHYRLDGFLLERIHLRGALEAGIYASAYRLLDAGNIIGYLTASFLVPFIAKHLKEKTAVQETLLNTRHVLIFFSIGIVCFVFIFPVWIENLLYHSDNPYNASVIKFCIAALPAYYLVHIYGSMLTAAAKFKPFIIILIISVVLNIFLNVLLIPAYGALGCCIAALTSQYFCGIASMLAATKQFSISYHAKSFFSYLLSALLLLSLFYFEKISIVNVWLVVPVTVCIILVFLITQFSFIKKHFVLSQ